MKLDMDSDLINSLQKIGLNKYESKAYLALATSGPLTASELSEKTDIPRPRTYDILNKLDDKGMASIQPGRPAKYNSHPVEESLDNLKKTKKEEHRKELEEIEEVKEEFQRKAGEVDTGEKTDPEDFMWFLRDKNKIHSKIQSLVKNAEREITIATDTEDANKHIDTHGELLQEAMERGVDVKLVTGKSKDLDRSLDSAEVIESDHDHRFMTIDDHSILFLNPSEESEEVGAWVKSPFFTQGLKSKLHPGKG